MIVIHLNQPRSVTVTNGRGGGQKNEGGTLYVWEGVIFGSGFDIHMIYIKSS